MADKANLTFGYSGTDFKRIYPLDIADTIAAADRADFVRNTVKDINASLAGGTDGSLGSFFRADDYDGTNGNFNRIINAEIEEDTVKVIYPAQGGN